MKTIILKSKQWQRYCLTRIKEAKLDGSETVIFKKTDKTPSAGQRRLQWLWYGEVADSGIGSDDTKEAVHTRSKWLFLKPILLRDDDIFPILYTAFIDKIKPYDRASKMEYRRQFAEDWLSTESITMRQRAEYLRNFQRYWVEKGVTLTDPALRGVDLNKY